MANSAKLAQIHGASLEDTTYALSSVMKAYNQSASQTTRTSSILNAVVGQGDMRFQDFVQSIQSWGPTGASMGISIRSMGAALAYLTDRGNSAETAATRLTMGLSMVTSPSEEASTFLHSLGLEAGKTSLASKSLASVMNHYGVTTSKVAADLKQPDGIFVALTQIKDAFHHAGLSASQADAVMAKIFGGGRSDKAILSLMQNLDGVQTKYDDIGQAAGVSSKVAQKAMDDLGAGTRRVIQPVATASGYAASWAKTQHTVAMQFHTSVAQIENMAISLGSKLLPTVDKVLTALNQFLTSLQRNQGEAKTIATIVGGILALAFERKLAHGLEGAKKAFEDMWKVGKAVSEGLGKIPGLLGKIPGKVSKIGEECGKAWGAVTKAAKTSWNAITKAANAAWSGISKAAKAAWSGITTAAKAAWGAISSAAKAAWSGITTAASAAWSAITTAATAAWSAITTAAAAAWSAMTAAATAAWEAIVAASTAALEAVVTAASAAWDMITAMFATNPVGLIIIAIGLLVVAFVELWKHCSAFRDFWKALWHDIQNAFDKVVDFIKTHWKLIVAILTGPIGIAVAFIISHWHDITKGFQEAWNNLKAVAGAVWGWIDSNLIQPIEHGVDHLVSWVKSAWHALGDFIRTYLIGPVDAIVSYIRTKWDAFISDTAQLVTDVVNFFKALPGRVVGFLEYLGSELLSIGKNAIQGLINGIEDMAGALWAKAKSIASGITGIFKSVLKMASPSRVMQEIGHYIGAGLIKGLEGSRARVNDACKKLVDEVRRAFDDRLISQGTYSRLTNFIGRDNNRLDRLASERAAIMKKIAAAKAYAKSVTSSTEQFAGLSGLTSVSNAQNGSPLYSGDILSDLKGKLATIRQFAAALKKLKHLGLDRNLINQIVQMGPEQGLQVAQALIEGPASVIKQLDQSQTAINKASRNLGRQTADEMYDSGKQAGKGFLTGLEHQQKNIEKLMRKIARSMVDTIRKELGISSPSKVARYHGQMWSEGLALGVEDGEARITASARRVTAALTGGVRGGAPRAAGGGGGDTYVFSPHITLNGVIASDRRELQAALWPLLQQAALQFNRRNGAHNNGLSLAAGRFG